MENLQKQLLGLVVAAVILGGGWYFLTYHSNPNNTNVINSSFNGNMANKNINNNSKNVNSIGQLTNLEFSNLSLTYPQSWETKSIPGSSNCRGFISPELVEYNQRNVKNSTNSTDAIFSYNVTVCNHGPITASLQKIAENWIRNIGATVIIPIQSNIPFTGAIRYRISTIRSFDVVFYKRNGYVIRAVLELLPYQNTQENENRINLLLQSVK